jgi:hypothetical protein
LSALVSTVYAVNTFLYWDTWTLLFALYKNPFNKEILFAFNNSVNPNLYSLFITLIQQYVH